MISRILFTVLLLVVELTSFGQSLNDNLRKDLEATLKQFQACSGAECSKFIGESLNTVYGVNDFYSTTQKRFMMATEIANFLKNSKAWKNLGPVYDQQTLTKAQEQANAKKAVVAVYMNEAGVGHVVVILPGTLQTSGSWGLKVPNVASFFTTQPDKSFVDKALSYAFSKGMMKDILIYSRN